MRDWVYCILIALCFVLNVSLTSSAILLVILIYIFFKNVPNVKRLSNIKLLLFLSFFISFLFGLWNGIVIAQLIRFFSMFILFWTYPLKFSLNKHHIIMLLIVGSYLIVMQVGKGLGVSAIDNFITINYPIDKLFVETQYDDLSGLLSGFDNRLAGISSNANAMGISILFLYTTIIIGLRKYFNSLTVYLVFILSFFSILLTGGRSALFTFFTMNCIIFFKQIKQNKLLLFALFAIVLYIINFSTIAGFRALDIMSLFSGKESSGSVKVHKLLEYWNEIRMGNLKDFLFFIFGKLNWNKQFDADLGYIITFLGLTGLFSIITFYCIVFKNSFRKYRFVFCLFLICIGGTIVTNYRFNILMFLILSSVNKGIVLDQNTKDMIVEVNK